MSLPCANLSASIINAHYTVFSGFLTMTLIKVKILTYLKLNIFRANVDVMTIGAENK
jgi:hypothetical protein